MTQQEVFGQAQAKPRVWEMIELGFVAQNQYTNPYLDVEMWVQLKGPHGFDKRIYGFWDGGQSFKVRLAATEVGHWTWKSYASPDDPGLSGKTGEFDATGWSEAEKQANPNRRGFIRPTANGHALEYADGTPFFLIGDTWLSAATWRYPLSGIEPESDYVPGPGITFEAAVQYRKRQGYNSISFISSFPNWYVDEWPRAVQDDDGVWLRDPWVKSGTDTAKDQHDEAGHVPFPVRGDVKCVSDFTKLNPKYYQSLDKKMAYLAQNGFVPMIETIRRDVGPAWKKYGGWPDTYVRFVQYLAARYGAYNIIFSKIHQDLNVDDAGLKGEDWNKVLALHLERYGHMPYGQPVTSLVDHSTLVTYGLAPWITMHSVGNDPRTHQICAAMETIFELDPPYPMCNLEPYYTDWQERNVHGERPPTNSDRDNYFARAQMYGSVLSGGLVGHVHGTSGYDGNTTGEPEAESGRPYIWEALQFTSGAQMQHLKTVILSEGARYQNLLLATVDVNPAKSPGSFEDGLDGWSFMMRTTDKRLAFLYFERGTERAHLKNMVAFAIYNLVWFDPRTGAWLEPVSIETDSQGQMRLPVFPGGKDEAIEDWALKITLFQATGP
ncbi:MAG: DUF4038 domain-containing protein [Anaerolineae bacterium]|nr:DUF4038 domain-containing protein [Anaerolineae bacterium]